MNKSTRSPWSQMAQILLHTSRELIGSTGNMKLIPIIGTFDMKKKQVNKTGLQR